MQSDDRIQPEIHFMANYLFDQSMKMVRKEV